MTKHNKKEIKPCWTSLAISLALSWAEFRNSKSPLSKLQHLIIFLKHASTTCSHTDEHLHDFHFTKGAISIAKHIAVWAVVALMNINSGWTDDPALACLQLSVIRIQFLALPPASIALAKLRKLNLFGGCRWMWVQSHKVWTEHSGSSWAAVVKCC